MRSLLDLDVVSPLSRPGCPAVCDPALSTTDGDKRGATQSILPANRQHAREQPPAPEPEPARPEAINNRQPRHFGTAGRWQLALKRLDYALQPIVNIHTGVCHGCEALLRNSAELGFASITALFDAAYEDGVLPEVDLTLRSKAIAKFTEIAFHQRLMLFYNVDNRLLFGANQVGHDLTHQNFVRRFGIHPGQFVYEISERHYENLHILHDCHNLKNLKALLNIYRGELFRYAIDDFGVGLSGPQLLYHTAPDFLKIDRFFIDGVATDQRKQLFLSSTISMIRNLGSAIIAEGVETTEDFAVCNKFGCDYVQGYLVQRPTTSSAEIQESYPLIRELQSHKRRQVDQDPYQIRQRLEQITPINLYDQDDQMVTMSQIFELFSHNQDNSLFPVLNPNLEPIGVVRERNLKEYAYSPFGRDILLNRASASDYIPRFITRMPTVEIRTKIESILEVFSQNQSIEGVLITEHGKYQGFLSSNALLKLLSERNIEEARDQNPLTRLPGNFLINRYVAESNSDTNSTYVYGYFDFDNFKPFNDTYGLRNGDRAILMFADLLRETANRVPCFIGHVGGDDFFIGFKLDDDQLTQQFCRELMLDLCHRFASDVTGIYSPADQRKGCIESLDREGKVQCFPLLSISAAMLHRPPTDQIYPLEETFKALAELKKRAKNSKEKFASASIDPDAL